jgi:nucleotide-binding universal stress UspA family protein
MSGSILVPLDGSEFAEGVLPLVQDLARRLSARVHFLRVVALGPFLFVAASAGRDYSARMLTHEMSVEAILAASQLRDLVEEWRGRGVDACWEVICGEPDECIMESARRHGVDFIAMCTHGRRGVGRLVLGSVADRVVRESGVPVLLVKRRSAATSASPVQPNPVAAGAVSSSRSTPRASDQAHRRNRVVLSRRAG